MHPIQLSRKRFEVSLFGVLVWTALAPAGASGQTAETVGRFHVVWEDPPEGEPRIHYYVADAQNRLTELRLDARVLREAGSPISLDGQYVRVEGTRVPDVTGSGAESVMTVERLTPEFDFAQLRAGARGNGPWVTILCRFGDSQSAPRDRGWYDQLMGSSYPGVADFWSEVSYGQHDVSGSLALGWYDLPDPRSAYFQQGDSSNPDLTKLRDDCAGAADADIDFSTIAGVHMQFNESLGCCSWGGSGWLELDGVARFYPMTWLAPWADQHTYAHEMGHGIGMPHSSGPYDAVYDSNWDVMSRGHSHRDGTFGWIAPHTISYHKDLVGWIDVSTTYVPAPGSTATIRLVRLGEAASGSDYAFAKVPLENGDVYTVEARRFIGYDQNLPGQAVVIHRVDPDRASGVPAHVVDPDNDGNPNDDGAMWLPGETFSDPEAGLTVAIEGETPAGFNVTISLADGGNGDPPPPPPDPVPQITLEPASIATEVIAGGEPVSRTFTVQNSGTGTLEWLVTSGQSWSDWLSFEPSSGSLAAGASAEVTATIDPIALTPGTHSATVQVAGNAGNSPQSLTVEITVTAVQGPVLGLSPASVEFRVKGNKPPGPKNMKISNSGGENLSWTAASDKTWLTLGSGGGTLATGASADVSLSVSLEGLEAGTHTATITVSGNADNSPQTVTAVLKMSKGGAKRVKRKNLSFAASPSEEPLAESFEIENIGDADATWEASADQSWIAFDPVEGSLAAGKNQEVTVEVHKSGLAAGTHTGTITILGDDEEPVSVAVSFTVVSGPGVRHTPDEVAAHILGGVPILEDDEVLYLDQVGNGNGKLEIGDMRAWLQQAGQLKKKGP